ncbi:hypothetical protein PUN4_180060 [Paraburkholderia unamae]|nr:hypothetical protein PUN4_180060 [Paraburkholderia unamae]
MAGDRAPRCDRTLFNSRYGKHLKELRELSGDDFEKNIEPIVCFLCAAREAVSAKQLLQWTELSDASLRRVLLLLHEFLTIEGSGPQLKYRIYHESFKDYIKEKHSLTEQHRKIADVALTAIGLMKHERTLR